MLPVQRLYGQTPFVTVPNSHCRPCVGCTKNCYDFNPKVAYLADQYDDDRRYVGFRRFFAAVFPGFVLAFYLVPDPPASRCRGCIFEFAAYMAASLGRVHHPRDLRQGPRQHAHRPVRGRGVQHLLLVRAETLVGAVGELVQATPAPLWTWVIRGAVLAVTLVWFARTLLVEKRFVALSVDDGRRGRGAARRRRGGGDREGRNARKRAGRFQTGG